MLFVNSVLSLFRVSNHDYKCQTLPFNCSVSDSKSNVDVRSEYFKPVPTMNGACYCARYDMSVVNGRERTACL